MREPPRPLPRGALLAAAGKPNPMIYRLRSGLIARFKILPDGRHQIIMFRLPGDLLGLAGLLLERQLYSVQVAAPAIVQGLDYATALELARRDPDVALRFMWQLAEDERRLHNWITALGRGSAVERIALLILDLESRLHQAGLPPTHRFTLPLTQQQIADHLGLTLVHVNRTLRKLREEKVLALRRRIVEIGDVAALRRYAAPLQDASERALPGSGAMVG